MGGVFKHPKTPKLVAFSTYPKSPTQLRLLPTEKLLKPAITWKSWALRVNRQVDQRLHHAWPKHQCRWRYQLVSPVAVAPLPHVTATGDAPMMLAFYVMFSCRVRSKQHPRGKSIKTAPNGEIVCKTTPFGAICHESPPPNPVILTGLTHFHYHLHFVFSLHEPPFLSFSSSTQHQPNPCIDPRDREE